MGRLTQMSYLYDGSFAGFLTCVFTAFDQREEPVCFSPLDAPHITLWPDRGVETDREKARRVYQSLARRISLDAQRMVQDGFLTCLEEKERRLLDFIRLGYQMGPAVTRNLTDDRVAVLHRALGHLGGEVHLLKGFVRFSDQGGVLVGEIAPKNRVLPLLRPHFCARFSGENFLLYDRVHREALFHQSGRWAIAPLEEFQMGAPDQEEMGYRRLWRRFYDTVAIEGRYNPKCRMTQMPKRYWATMTEFQEEGAPALPP